MDPNQIAQMLASGDPKKVKEAQVTLQALGYPVKPDGKLGDATSAAVAAYRRDAATNAATARDTAASEAAAKTAENDPVNRLTKLGTEVAPYGVGVGVGTGVGHAFGKAFQNLDEKSGAQVSSLGQASDIDPVIKRQQMNRLMGGRNLRNAAQFAAPALLAGAGYATRNYIAPQFSDPSARDIVNSVGTGENAAAATLGVHQTVSSLLRGSPYDQTDVARIRSDALPDDQRRVSPPRSMPLQAQTIDVAPEAPQAALPPPAAAPTPPSDPIQHGQRLSQAVAATGGKPSTSKATNYAALAKGLTSENMGSVAEALKLPAEANKRTILQRARELTNVRGTSAWLLPMAAAGAAYEMSRNQAEAGNGDTSGSSPATAAAVAGGTAFGANKLLQAVPRLGPVMNAAGVGMAAYDNATEAKGYRDALPPEQRDGVAGMLSHAMPLAMRGASDIGSIASAPGRIRDAAASAMTPGNATPQDYQSALYPESVPPDTAAPPAQDFDAQLAELQQLLASQGAPDPSQAPAQAQQVAPAPVQFPMPQNKLLGAR